MTAIAPRRARLGVDIGGTFTDVAIEVGERTVTAKVLTTPRSPADGVMAAIRVALDEAGLAPRDVGLIIHGTTLATNALIERKGARTAIIATEGHRDTLELGYEDRFSEYDIFIEKSVPLVPRDLRFTVPERCGVAGQVLRALDVQAVERLAPELRRQRIESIAVCFIHSYANPTHERAVRRILAAALPDVAISVSSEVCPEIRGYDRISTTVCNAYVQPLMAGYLRRLSAMLATEGFDCPMLMMLSGGGLATLETAIQFPIRLVESGPAGGAIIAAQIAARMWVARDLSFDMGGTTAKICLIDNFRPPTSRNFEVDRVYRFLKGSGLSGTHTSDRDGGDRRRRRLDCRRRPLAAAAGRTTQRRRGAGSRLLRPRRPGPDGHRRRSIARPHRRRALRRRPVSPRPRCRAAGGRIADRHIVATGRDALRPRHQRNRR